MRDSPAGTRRAVVFAAPVLLFSLLQPTQPAPAAAAATTYQGTVHAVQPSSASFDLITGVGFALRLVHIRTVPETRMTSDGAAFAFSDIKPGDILRAECRMTEAGLVADRIERVTPVGAPRRGQP